MLSTSCCDVLILCDLKLYSYNAIYLMFPNSFCVFFFNKLPLCPRANRIYVAPQRAYLSDAMSAHKYKQDFAHIMHPGRHHLSASSLSSCGEESGIFGNRL